MVTGTKTDKTDIYNMRLRHTTERGERPTGNIVYENPGIGLLRHTVLCRTETRAISFAMVETS